MKPKELSKKLILNKITVADLSGNEMTKVKGGCGPSDPRSCATNISCTCVQQCFKSIPYTNCDTDTDPFPTEP